MRKFVLFFALAMLCVGQVFASDTQVDGIYYNFDNENLIAEVTFRGSSHNSFADEYTGSVVIPSTVSYQNLTYSVIGIGSVAFSNCKGLTSVTIPASVTRIGESVFSGCTFPRINYLGTLSQWCDINIRSPFGNQIILLINGMEIKDDLVIPEGVTSIGSDAFSNCNLRKFICLSTQWDGVFDTSLFFDDSIDIFNTSTLDTVVMPAASYNLPETEWAGLAKNIKYIGVTHGELSADGFAVINRSYKTLKTIDLERATNTEIADEAFKGCYNLETLKLPAQTEHIGYMAMAECKMLQAIDIPASVIDIDDSAFENCRSIKTITFGGNAPQAAVAHGMARAAANSESALQRIGNWAFYNCHELQNLEIPEGVTEVGAAAFYGCVYLENLSLPSSVRSIGDNCFAHCAKLKSISVAAKVPPTIDAKTFYDVNRETPLLVPESALNDYANDQYWGEFLNIHGVEEIADVTLLERIEANPTIFARDGRIVGAENAKIYDLLGRDVTKENGNLKGVYIVKTENTAMKIVVR